MEKLTTHKEMKDRVFGKIGSPLRDEYEQEAQAFIIGEMIKSHRKEAHLTQEELAERIGSKKSYISRIENGKSEINISTLTKIAEKGLGKRLTVMIA